MSSVLEDSSSDARGDEATQADPLIGKIINEQYKVLSLLGSGGVGLVYRALQLATDRPVALKVLRHGYSDVSLLRKRFEREAQLMSNLRHPHIVSMTDYGIHNDTPYLILELLEGITLDAELERGLLGSKRIYEITRAILRAMSYAHEQGVMHRDLKPGNIFLQDLLPNEHSDPGHVRLLDFGMAKLLPQGEEEEHDPTLTRSGAIIGTPRYMAPEQAAGESVDARSDVYSAGVLLFEMLAGRAPFEAENRTALLRAHLVEPVPDPRQLREGLEISDDMRAFLLKAMAKDRGDRFVDGSEMLRAFELVGEDAVICHAQSSIKPDAGRLTPLDNKLSREPRIASRTPKLVWVVVASLALGLAGLWWALRDTDNPTGSVPPPVGTSVVPPAESTPTDVDYFSRLPAQMQEIQSRVSKSEQLDRIAHRDMRRLQRQHPADPRPSLILAHDFSTRGSRDNAITRYRQALRIDDKAFRYPHMLPDLVAIVGSSEDESNRSAMSLILQTYDDQQLSAVVQKAITESEQRSVRSRLKELLRRSAQR